MKDTTVSYDLVHQQQPQHSWNQQQQQQQQQQQPQQRQHQTHTTSVYSNQASQQSQRLAVGSQQQQQHAPAQLNQYHHQQLQSSAHHNSAAAAAAYYQQAHLYPSYQTHAHSQDQQQHSNPDIQHGHHHHLPSSTVTVPATASSSVVNAAVVAAAAVAAQQQQHAPVHHQAPNNTQASALNHTGWSGPGVTSMTPHTHHPVVTDHSTLAYMTHAYQSHNSNVNNHHRNSNGPMANQPIGTGPQGSSYAVDTLYNGQVAAAAAAVAAYGYNNYNAAFFQTSTNGPHTQAGHPSPASMSNFWNHNQAPQQRTSQAQPVANQANVQQRQPMVPEQAPGGNYMHDPRIYYGRPAYDQNMQNYGQAHHSQTQPQADVLHQRMTALNQQQQLLQHHEQQQLHQVTSHQQHQLHSQLHHPSQTLTNTQNQPASNQQSSQNSANPLPTSTNLVQSNNRQQMANAVKSSPQHQKQASSDSDNITKTSNQLKGQLEYELSSTAPTTQQPPQLSQTTSHPSNKDSSTLNKQHVMSTINKEPIQVQQQQSPSSSLSPITKPTGTQIVIKNENTSQYQRKTNTMSQVQRNSYRDQQEDRIKSQALDSIKRASERDVRPPDTRGRLSPPSSRQQQDSLDQPQPLEDSMASLSITASRKTTWASIASQPAKVSVPKSLKSKIAGSNSVLSSAKHLAAVSLDSSNSETKNGINPAIKSSVSAAATSIQRSSVPPPISKLTSAVASLKLDLLGDQSNESSRISWPAVNASINLKLDEPSPLKATSTNNSMNDNSFDSNERHKKEDVYRGRDSREHMFKDHNHNQGSNTKMVNSYHQPSNPHGSGRDFWNRRDQRDYQARRDSERKESLEHEKHNEHHDDGRDQMNSRREHKTGVIRMNHFRGDDKDQYRDRDYGKRNVLNDRNEQRSNDAYQNPRFPNNRFDARDSHPHQHNNQNHSHGNRHNDNNQQAHHHHYNNVRDGNAGNPLSKPDLSLHPHLNPTNFNPKVFNLEPSEARYFIIKSYSEDDIHRSIKYSIWCSTNHGNKRLDEAYRQQQTKDGPIYLFFSVNGSGHFCGMAQMMSSVDFDSSSGVWAQSKWQGEFSVKWIYVKDVPNTALRHITLENNEDKPVTNSRDTQEVPSEKGKAVLKILHQYPHTTSIFDDFVHYERRQQEEKFKKSHSDQPSNRSDERERGGGPISGRPSNGRPFMNARPHNDFQSNREKPARFAS